MLSRENVFDELLLILKHFKVVDRFFTFCVYVIILYLSGEPHTYDILASINIPMCPRAPGGNLG